MLRLTFYPEHSDSLLAAAAQEYQTSWHANCEGIVEALERVAGLEFNETALNALVYERPSQSHPLLFRASYLPAIKRGAIVHELCHRLTAGNNIPLLADDEAPKLAHHKQIDLILFDSWVRAFNTSFAKRMVEHERRLDPAYSQAWDWALAMTAEQRGKLFDVLRQWTAREHNGAVPSARRMQGDGCF